MLGFLRTLIVAALLSQVVAFTRTSAFTRLNGAKFTQKHAPVAAKNTKLHMNLPAALASIDPKMVAAAPVMYALMSVNEYITHRYYQHAEFNKNEFMKKFTCAIMNVEKAPKVKGGGHIEHHAETYDDMTLKYGYDKRWDKTPAAKALEADEFRGTAFSWKVLGLMTIQMLPTVIPVFALMGFNLLQTAAWLIPGMLIHGIVWNTVHPTMHGLKDVSISEGPPSFPAIRKNWYFDYLYQNHVGHHVLGGQGNYNVCCPLTDHLLGKFRSVTKRVHGTPFMTSTTPYVHPNRKFSNQF